MVSESSPSLFPPLSISFTLPASYPTPIFKRFGGAGASALETCPVHEAGAAESGAPGAGSPQEYGLVLEQLSVLRPQTRRVEGGSCRHASCRQERSLPVRLQQPPFQRTWLCKHAGGWLHTHVKGSCANVCLLQAPKLSLYLLLGCWVGEG